MFMLVTLEHLIFDFLLEEKGHPESCLFNINLIITEYVVSVEDDIIW